MMIRKPEPVVSPDVRSYSRRDKGSSWLSYPGGSSSSWWCVFTPFRPTVHQKNFSLPLLLLLLVGLFTPDNQDPLLSDWPTAPGWSECVTGKVSSASSAGHTPLRAFPAGSAALVFFNNKSGATNCLALDQSLLQKTSNPSTKVPLTYLEWLSFFKKIFNGDQEGKGSACESL